LNQVKRSLALSALDSYLGLVLQLASTVIIARLLTPAQTGIFAVAAVFAALASTFRDFGVAEYLIQETDLKDDSIRAALTVNISVSWLMALLLWVLSPVAADFYKEPGVAQVMQVQAFSFVLIPFGAVTMAWFRRELNFKPLLVAGLLANSTSFVVSVVMALNGHGYMSLAWASLAGVVVTVCASLWFRPATFPKWPGLRGVGRVLSFGKFASGIYIFGQLGKGAPEMVIGRTLDMASVGIFSRGYGLIEIFNRLVLRAVLPVCLPFFAQAVRESGSPVKGVLTTTSYLTVIGWTFLGFMGLTAFGAVRLMYGPQWLAAVALAQVLCGAAALELLYFTAKEALLAVGKAKESNSLQMLIQGLRVLGLLAVIPFGLAGACWGLLVAAALGAVSAFVFLRWHDVQPVLQRSALVAACSLAPVALWVYWVPMNESNYGRLLAGAAVLVTACWLAALRWWQHPFWNELLHGARTLMRRVRPKA
jgi:O-antigen/teichoic acid export membrane protein